MPEAAQDPIRRAAKTAADFCLIPARYHESIDDLFLHIEMISAVVGSGFNLDEGRFDGAREGFSILADQLTAAIGDLHHVVTLKVKELENIVTSKVKELDNLNRIKPVGREPNSSEINPRRSRPGGTSPDLTAPLDGDADHLPGRAAR